MLEEAFQPKRVLKELRDRSVRHVLIGDFASAAYGSAQAADRVEVCVPDDGDDIARLGLMLQALGGRQEEGTGDPHRASFRTIVGRVECREMSSTGFAEMEARASNIDVGGGVMARVASQQDIEAYRPALLHQSAVVGATQLGESEGERGGESKGHVARFGRLKAARAAPDAPIASLDAPHRPRTSTWKRVLESLEKVDDFMTDLDRGKWPGSKGPR